MSKEPEVNLLVAGTLNDKKNVFLPGFPLKAYLVPLPISHTLIIHDGHADFNIKSFFWFLYQISWFCKWLRCFTDLTRILSWRTNNDGEIF